MVPQAVCNEGMQCAARRSPVKHSTAPRELHPPLRWRSEQARPQPACCVPQGYPANPYHNRVHAADVLRNLHVIVTRGGVLKQLGAARAPAPEAADLLASRMSCDHSNPGAATCGKSSSQLGGTLFYHPKNLAEWRELLAW